MPHMLMTIFNHLNRKDQQSLVVEMVGLSTILFIYVLYFISVFRVLNVA